MVPFGIEYTDLIQIKCNCLKVKRLNSPEIVTACNAESSYLQFNPPEKSRTKRIKPRLYTAIQYNQYQNFMVNYRN